MRRSPALPDPTRRDPDTVAVGVLGSFKDGGELDLTLFLLAWEAAHPQTTINLIAR